MKQFNPAGLIFGAVTLFTLISLLSAGLARTELSFGLVVLFSACVGVLIVLPVIRRLVRISAALDRFNRDGAGTKIQEQSIDPLGGLVSVVNAIITKETGESWRSAFADQAVQAAAQMERNRLARELHDSIKQQLFSIQMSTAAAEQRMEGDTGGALSALQDARKSTTEAMLEMNALLQQLSPAPLEKVGLVQALKEQCEALSYRTGAEVAHEIGELPPDGWLPIGTQECLFRVTQEALSNIARHARAKKVNLSLAWHSDRDQLFMTIQDDGSGFDPQSVPMGIGLTSMRERVVGLGGTFHLESSVGSGTRLKVVFDVFPDNDAVETAQVAAFPANRVILIGLLGGALASICLSWPWYFQARAVQWTNWPGGVNGLMLLSFLAAGLVLFGTGWLSARVLKAGGVIAGAAAGAVAGLTPYGLLGAAWAGVRGTQALLGQGLTFIPDEGEAITLVVSGIGTAFLWANGVYWVMLICGIGLGALGGLVYERASEVPFPSDWRKTVDLLAGPFLISSGLALLLGVFLLPLVEASALDAVARHSPENLVSLRSLIRAALMSGLLTPAVYYLAAQAARYGSLARDVPLMPVATYNDLHWRAFGLATFSACFALIGGLISLSYLRDFTGNYPSQAGGNNLSLIVSISLVAINFVLVVMYLAQVGRIRRRLVETKQNAPSMALYIALLGAPVVVVTGFSYLFMFGSGWPALIGLLIEAALLIYLVATNPGKTGYALANFRQRREHFTQLRTAWVAVAYAFVAPVLAMGSAGLTIILIVVRMTRFFDSGRLPDSPLPNLTLPMMVEQVYIYMGGTYVVLLAAGLVLTGLMIAGLAVAGFSRRRGI